MSEFQFIQKLRSLLPRAEKERLFPDARGFIDDVCILGKVSEQYLICSHDTIVQDIHFFSNDAIEFVIKKAVRTNISDIISKGATPYGMTLSLSLSKPYHNTAAQDKIIQSLREEIALYNIPLLGGDITASHHLVISIAMFGLCYQMPPCRSDAKIGDKIFVTGVLGLSKIGLDIRLGKFDNEGLDNKSFYEQAYLLPSPPPVKAALSLMPYMNASMDISDGLLVDLNKIADASDVSFKLNFDTIPIAPLDDKTYALDCALNGGDDYQILFTSSADISLIDSVAQENNIKITEIGVITDKVIKNNYKYTFFNHL